MSLTLQPADPTLPTSLVLSYITPVNSPTRVRTVAWRGLLGISILQLIVAAWKGIPLAIAIYETLDEIRRWGAFPSEILSYLLRDFIQNWLLDFFVTFCCGVSALIQLFCILGVRKGRPTASILGMISLYSPIALLSIAAALAGGTILDATFGFYRPRTGPWAFLLLIPMPFVVVCILLLKDLCGFLLWISRHPREEKAPVSFLTGSVEP